MVQLGLLVDQKRQVLQWDVLTVLMKEPSGILVQTDLTSRDVHEVVMQTVEPFSTMEANERLVKILDSVYVKAYL